MTKPAIVIFSYTEPMEAIGKGDDLQIVFEGAGTKRIGTLEQGNHKLRNLYLNIKNTITGACSFC